MRGPERISSSLAVRSTLVLILVWIIALAGCGDGHPPSPIPSTQSGFVYTANGGSDDVAALKENLNTGALSAATGSPFHAGDINENVPGVLTVDPAGKFLYVGDANSAEISTFSINRDTGVLTEVADSPFPSGASAATRVHPSGKFLYAANFDQGSISAFNIDSGTGVLSEIPGSPFALDGLVMS
jgi:6-phosphogluconolactonase